METILITYATMTGNSEIAATSLYNFLQAQFPKKKFALQNIRDISIKKILVYDKIIFGVSTWGYGTNYDTDDFLQSLKKNEGLVSGASFALFGLGDTQYEQFCQAVKVVKNELVQQGVFVYKTIFTIDGFPNTSQLLELHHWAEQYLSWQPEHRI